VKIKNLTIWSSLFSVALKYNIDVDTTREKLSFLRVHSSLSKSFTLTLSGECQFSPQDKKQLSVLSRIGVWGCWLAFEDEDSKNLSCIKKLLKNLYSSTVFIPQSSVTPKQYARLCRVVMKLKANSKTD